MSNSKGFSPKYRIDIYPVNGGESWIAEVYADGEEVVVLDRMFISSTLDDAVDHVMDIYEEEFEVEDEF